MTLTPKTLTPKTLTPKTLTPKTLTPKNQTPKLGFSPSIRLLVACLIASVTILFCEIANGQNVSILRFRDLSGKIEKMGGNSMTVTTPDGAKEVLFAKPGKQIIPLTKGGINLRFPTDISVKGDVAASSLRPGQVIRFSANLSKPGRVKGSAQRLELQGDQDSPLTIKPSRTAKNSIDFVPCEVIAKVVQLRGTSLNLELDRQPFAPTGKLRLRLDKNCVLQVQEKSLARVTTGDRIVSMKVADLDTGDTVVQSMKVELASKEVAAAAPSGKRTKKPTADRFAESNYLKFSDQPAQPRDVRSQNFLLHTDLSDRSAKILLDKLEYMSGMIGQYYGRRQKGLIECFVVRDLTQWKNIPLEPAGVEKIRARAGVTISRSLGKQRKSIVYSCDKHGVVQHEAVHAFCAQTFGSTGPTWYSEGMAEMGQYWKKDNLAVAIPAPVIRYLTNARPKKMLDIVAAGQITGDSWQAYAWRWALCHLLANNPNYSVRFKALGMNMMSGGKATFESVYGDFAAEISFEYDQFVEHFGNGYRVDLCTWDWETKPRPISGSRKIKCEVSAKRGWQATGLKLNAGKKYSYDTDGKWRLSLSEPDRDANGTPQGKGKLIGVVLNNYQLSKVLELGAKGEFVAESDGQLYVRCQDDFTKLADNEGKIVLQLKRSND